MGTRINYLFRHSLADWTDRQKSLEILSTVLPAVNAVEDYWSTHDKNHLPQTATWIAEPPFPPQETRDYFRYTCPGCFFSVSINPYVVLIHTGGRWRGFLSIPRLREVHLAAFRAIAKVFHAKAAICFADNDHVLDEFWEGRDLADCVAVLQQRMGDPVKMDESIDPETAEATDYGCPRLWYWDELD